MKEYTHNGLSGCVQQTRSRITGTLVGLYHGDQSGIESDPEVPWTTVCEEHNTLVCHRTLRLARDHAPDPTGWCQECRDNVAEKNSEKHS